MFGVVEVDSSNAMHV